VQGEELAVIRKLFLANIIVAARAKILARSPIF
jgi:hypothetical protein